MVFGTRDLKYFILGTSGNDIGQYLGSSNVKHQKASRALGGQGSPQDSSAVERFHNSVSRQHHKTAQSEGASQGDLMLARSGSEICLPLGDTVCLRYPKRAGSYCSQDRR